MDESVFIGNTAGAEAVGGGSEEAQVGIDVVGDGEGQSGIEFLRGGGGDHGGVVSAEFGIGNVERGAVLGTGLREGDAEGFVAEDATGGDEAFAAGGVEGVAGFAGEDVDDGTLEGGAEVGNPGGVVMSLRILFKEITDGSFETAEAEVVVVFLREGSGKGAGFGVALLGEGFDARAAGIG